MPTYVDSRRVEAAIILVVTKIPGWQILGSFASVSGLLSTTGLPPQCVPFRLPEPRYRTKTKRISHCSIQATRIRYF